jgi:hypothetical protein
MLYLQLGLLLLLELIFCQVISSTDWNFENAGKSHSYKLHSKITINGSVLGARVYQQLVAISFSFSKLILLQLSLLYLILVRI